VRRALPTLLAVLVVGGLLAAAVLASPDEDDRGGKTGGGALSLMGNAPTEHAPEFEEFEELEPPNAPEPRRVAPPPLEPVQDLQPQQPVRPSKPIGKPWKGRLRNGAQFPESGKAFFTYDSPIQHSPSRWWRRWATDTSVARTLAVLNDFRAAHPDAPRIGVGDLSLPRGGHFGRQYGGIGHRSHQNGLDVDLYYPRKDRREEPPRKVSQVDRALSQELVDRFVAAGAEYVFVGPRVALRGPKGVVSKLANHDNHLHVRWRP
jgi:hypothetical protein